MRVSVATHTQHPDQVNVITLPAQFRLGESISVKLFFKITHLKSLGLTYIHYHV